MDTMSTYVEDLPEEEADQMFRDPGSTDPGHLPYFSAETPSAFPDSMSYSGINTYQRCPQQYYWKMIRKVQRKVKSLPLFNGINGHDFMQEFFLVIREMQQSGEDYQQHEYVEAGLEAVEAKAEEVIAASAGIVFEDELADARHETEMILTIIRNYIGQYVEEWEILHVEEEFELVLDNGYVITFTPDLVIRDRRGNVWIVDHKTTSGGNEAGIPFGDMQALLYYAGVKSVYPECVGFFFNRLRKKLPTQPRLTKTGKTRVADLQRIDTTYEILRDFLQEKAPGLLSEPSHQRRLAQLRDQSGRFFWTEEVYVTDETAARILDDAANVLEHIELSHKQDHWPRHLLESRGYKDCRKCPFQRLCQASLYGWDTDSILEEDYEPRDPKNPYEREEEIEL